MKIFIRLIILQVAFISSVYGQTTPIETVEIWNAAYGTAEMDKCADITTAKMRDNKPKSVWVYDTWKQLDKIDYRKETSEIIRHKIENDSAVIIVQSRIYALNGYVDQKELFTLLHIDGTWLIDKLIVGDEVLEEQLDLLL